MAVRRKKNGKIMVDFWLTHPDGHRERIRKTSPISTIRGAERYERELRESMLNGTYEQPVEKEIPLFSEFADTFIQDYADVQNRPSTVIGKKKNLRIHLVPAFGHLRLDQITQHRIDLYKRQKLDEGLKAKTINNHLTCLRKLLTVAHDWGKLDVVPTIKWLPKQEIPFDFLTFEESRDLIEAASGMWQVMILLALRTGARQSNLLEVRWDDFTFAEGNEKVRYSRSHYRGHTGPNKNGRAYEVPLSDDLIKTLTAYKRKTGGKGHQLLFTDKQGNRLTDNKCRRPLWNACEKAGLRKVLWHVLRHTFASHLAMRGQHVNTIKELMGHTHLTSTMRYMHLAPEVKRGAVKGLDS